MPFQDATLWLGSDMVASRPIRVAFCLDSFEIGGTELNAVRTAEALDPNRIELSIFHLQTHGPLRSRYERLGVRMTHVPISNLYSIRTALQGMRLAKMLRDANVDIVHSHDIYCNIFVVPWARIFTPCSIIASRRWSYYAPRAGLARINRLSAQFAHHILANSSGVANALAVEEGVPRKKIVEIPNFLETNAFVAVSPADRAAQRRAWGVPDGAFSIGIVARLRPVKNHVLLFKAASQLNDRFHLMIVGDGPLRAELENLARELGIESRVHFAGEVVSDRNLHQFLDVSVLCSLSEGFPNAVIEGMAAGRAVVATPVGGVIDAVTNGVTGLLVPVDDPAPLADALLSLEADSSLRARLGNAGRETVKAKFSQEFVIEKLSSLYETLSGRHPAPRSAFRRA